MKPESKILIVCQHFWPESFRINDIADYLIEKGYDVDVLCGTPNYPKGQFFEGYSFFRRRKETHNKIRIWRAYEIKRGNNSYPRIFLNYVSFPFFSIFKIPIFLTKKYDKILIYQTSPVMMAIAGIIIGKLKKVETIFYILDLWPENLYSVIKVKNKLLRIVSEKMSHWYYKKADKIIVLSERMRKRVEEFVLLPKSKIEIIPQTCEKIYEQKVHDTELTKRFKSGFNVVFTGNISPAQSLETVVAAAKMLEQDNITGINWIIVGDGMSKKWLEDEVRKANLSKRFFFEGQKPIDDMPKYLTLADVLIGCLSKSDLLEATIPAKVFSYLAAGKPIVLGMDGEVQDLINTTIKCGYAGPAGDAQALYDNIFKIYNMPKPQRDKMGARAEEYYKSNFEREIVLSRLLAFINKKTPEDKL